MPPTMQFEQKCPRHTHRALSLGQSRARKSVDQPETEPRSEADGAEHGRTPELPAELRVWNAFLQETEDVDADEMYHDAKCHDVNDRFVDIQIDCVDYKESGGESNGNLGRVLGSEGEDFEENEGGRKDHREIVG